MCLLLRLTTNYPMDMYISAQRLIYLGNQLIALPVAHWSDSPFFTSANPKLKRLAKKWRHKPSVPFVIMENVNSLTSKNAEMAALVKNVTSTGVQFAVPL